ncbi:MAG: hypothetical protein ABR549_17570 [Mycobacteriales bacterium]
MRLRELDDAAEKQLSSLDKRFVAAAAPKVARTVDGFHGAVRRTRDTAASLDLRDMNALDEKYAMRGPLALFREIPQLLAIVTGIVFLVGTLVAAHDLQTRQTARDQSVQTGDGGSSSSVPATLALGPTIGRPATSYLRLAASSLSSAAQADPDEQRLSLVTLSAYYRPAQAASILSGYVVKRAWVRASGAGRQAPPMPLEVSDDLAAALSSFYSRTAKGQGDAAVQYQQLADTTDDAQYKAFYGQFATLSRKQSEAFGRNCACVFSFVVTATPTQLLSLRSRPGVRAIEVAGKGAQLSNVDITLLLPEVMGVVPNPAAVVDPPS